MLTSGSRLSAGCKMYKRYTFGITGHLLGTRSWKEVKENVMKKDDQQIRNKFVNIRMSVDEYRTLETNRKKSTDKTNGSYLRKLALKQPITILTRNASIDALANELIRVRKELNYIGNNFNQAVHKLHTLDRIPEFREWLHTYEKTRLQLLQQTETTFLSIAKIVSQWSQE